MRTILSHLWEKVQIFLRFSLACAIPRKWFFAVMFLLVNLPLHDCLKIASFCQIWQGYSGFKSGEFLEVLCRQVTELQHICPSCLSSLVGYPCRERGYQRKATKELAQARGKQAASTEPSETVSWKVFCAQISPGSQSWDLQVESGSCWQAEQDSAVPKMRRVWHITLQ